jgi:uncharacterized protein
MSLINLPFIAQEAINKEEENIQFRYFLKSLSSEVIDEKMEPIGKHFTKAIDCTACGNCCKNIMISADSQEILKISNALQMEFDVCKKKYFESSTESDNHLINAIPCHFLKDDKCTVYENRPSACASFPHIDLPNFTSRLFSMLSGYGICPIIYHSMEALKNELVFKG